VPLAFWLTCLLAKTNGCGRKMWGPASLAAHVQVQPLTNSSGRRGWGLKDATAYLHGCSEWSKSNYYFPHFEITRRGSSILLQIEFHKPSKQFSLSLWNRLSSSSLSHSSGGGQLLLPLIAAAGWSQHKSPITIQNTITFSPPSHKILEKKLCLFEN